jgi:hypothetical protein
MYNKIVMLLIVWATAGVLYLNYQAERENIYLSIQSELADYHATYLQAGSAWPESIDSFDPSTTPIMNAWPKSGFHGFDIPYRKSKLNISLRGETMITARLYGIDTSHTHFDDFAPLDFAIAWGPAISDEFASKVRVYHTNRQAHFRSPRSHSLTGIMSNIHLIPGSVDMMRALSQAQPNDRIVLRGYAITARQANGSPWASDLNYGDENCEIIVVTEFLAERPNGTTRVHEAL